MQSSDEKPQTSDNASSNAKEENKISVQKLSLPKGGGAIQAINEKVQVQDFTGSASFSLPIATSPCRGIAPSLGIGYSSGSGNSEFGLGWNIDISKVSRKTSKGIPQYNDQDTFLLGSQDLVPNSTTPVRNASLNSIQYKVTTYIVRLESSYPLIEYWVPVSGVISQSFWKITTKDHSISILGARAEAKILNPTNPEQVFAWLIEESYSPVGDHQLWFYKQEDITNVGNAVYENNRVQTANRYLERVRYGHDEPVAGSMILSNNPLVNDPSKWHFEVVLDYGEYDISPTNANPYQPLAAGWLSRPDPFSLYSSGFEIRYHRLCRNSLMFHRFSELGQNPVLVHVTGYNYSLNAASISELVSSNGTGYQYDIASGTYTTASIPSVEFSYIDFTPEAGEFLPITKQNGKELPALTESANYSLVDLFGEGIPGILYNDSAVDYYSRPNLPETDYNPSKIPGPLYQKVNSNQGLTYAELKLLQQFPIARQVQTEYSTLMDITGNGQLDLVVSTPDLQGYFEVNPDESWENFQEFQEFPTDYQAPSQAWVDMTGEGLNDLVQVTENWIRVYQSLGSEGLGEPIIVRKNINSSDPDKNPADLPNTLASTPRKVVTFLDIDGSGRQHLVDIQTKTSGDGSILSVSYWPNLGYGKFGQKITMSNLPVINIDINSFDAKYLFFADLDGTGASDLIYMRNDRLIIYFNHNGNSFSDPVTISFPEDLRFDDNMQVSFADILGQGTSCMVISDPKNSSKRRHLYYDFCQGKKPYLIETTNNNCGARTELEYASSVDFYLADKKAGLNWITSLPFPVLVVKQSTAIDEISGSRYVSQYAYHHGYYDGVEREFRGFGRVDRQDAEYFSPQEIKEKLGDPDTYTAPSLTRSWYHTGAQPIASVSKQYLAEYYQGDAQAYELEDSTLVLNGNIDATTIQQAYTALAGMTLRSELYGLTEEQIALANPYSVSESNYSVHLKQAIDNNRYAVFMVKPQETISYAYECNPEDPRVSHQFTVTDDYGNPTHTASIAYPKRNNPLAQQGIKATAGVSNYVEPDLTPANYLIGVAYESKSFDITTLLPVIPANKAYGFTVIKQLLLSLTQGLLPQGAKLLNRSQVLYADPILPASSQLLPLGEVSLPVLVGEQHSVAFAPEDLATFSDVLTTAELTNKLEEGYYLEDEDGYWWNPGMRPIYDASKFWSVSSTKSPTGGVTAYTYDVYNLLLTKTEDALGNTAQSEDINYQFLAATTLVDPNGNKSQVAFDPLGQVIYTSFFGHETKDATVEAVGFDDITQAPKIKPDSVEEILENPDTFIGNMQSFFYYDLFAWQDRREPTLALSIAAEHYTTSNKPQVLHMAIAYTDGFGRGVQGKAKEEGGLAWHYDEEDNTITEVNTGIRWLTTGAVVYDNKGNKVKAYETYYSDTADYQSPDVILAKLIEADSRFGITPIMYYDPLNRVKQVTTPKGFIVKDTWTPWEQVSYDPNDTFDATTPYCQDNLGASLDPDSRYYDSSLPASARESIGALKNYFQISCFTDTPGKVILDNLGRAIISQVIKVSDGADAEVLSSYTTYDIKGAVLTTTDPRLSQRITPVANFTNTYSIEGQVTKVVSLDAGTKWALTNIFGNPLFGCDSRGIRTTNEYDVLQRPVAAKVFKAATADDPLALDQVINYFVYGDIPGAIIDPEQYNLRGQLYKHYDQAGLITVPSYSITGGALSSTRQFLTDYTRVANWNDIAAETANLQPTTYIDSMTYDALGRVINRTDVDNNITTPKYGLRGLLKSLTVKTNDDQVTREYVTNIDYDAKGQRQQISYGNNTVTNYEYDPKTYAVTNIITINSSSDNIQDLSYIYDPVGNILSKTDTAQNTSFYNNQEVSPTSSYVYDSLYQLIEAKGRQQSGSSSQVKEEKLKKDNDLYKPYQSKTDLQALEEYVEYYSYDKGGNLVTTEHLAMSGGWTRNMVVSPDSNRAVSSNIAQSIITPDQVDQYFDANGNQISLTQGNAISWNEHNNIAHYITIERSSGNNDGEYYVYDSAGQRVRKVALTYTNDEQVLNTNETIYLSNIEIRRTSRQLAVSPSAAPDNVLSDGAEYNDASDGIAAHNVMSLVHALQQHEIDESSTIVKVNECSTEVGIDKTSSISTGKQVVEEGESLSTVIQSSILWSDPVITKEYHTLAISDDTRVIANRHRWTVGKSPSCTSFVLFYSLTDHSGSATMDVDTSGNVVTIEEYAPYGSTTFFLGQGSALQLKVRHYSGKEKDATGLYYYGARYYSPTLGRWLSPDPIGPVDGPNIYVFLNEDPVNSIDLNGTTRYFISFLNKKEQRPFNDPVEQRNRVPEGYTYLNGNDEHNLANVQVDDIIINVHGNPTRASFIPGEDEPDINVSGMARNLVNMRIDLTQNRTYTLATCFSAESGLANQFATELVNRGAQAFRVIGAIGECSSTGVHVTAGGYSNATRNRVLNLEKYWPTSVLQGTNEGTVRETVRNPSGASIENNGITITRENGETTHELRFRSTLQTQLSLGAGINRTLSPDNNAPIRAEQALGRPRGGRGGRTGAPPRREAPAPRRVGGRTLFRGRGSRQTQTNARRAVIRRNALNANNRVGPRGRGRPRGRVRNVG